MSAIHCPDCGELLGQGTEPYVGAADDGVRLLTIPTSILEEHKKTCKGKASVEKHEVTMTITEVHEYNLMPIYAMGPGGPAHQMIASKTEGRTPLLCIHMQKTDKSPVEPDLPPEARMIVKSLQQAIPNINNMEHVSAQASIVLSPEEYDRMGRPRAHEKITVSFTYDGGR